MAGAARKLDLLTIAGGAVCALLCLGSLFFARQNEITLLFVCYYLVGLCGCALLLWLGRCRLLAYPGMVSAGTGLITSLWLDPVGAGISAEAVMAATFFPTAFFGYAGIMHAVCPRHPRIAWLPYAATAVGLLFSGSFAAWLIVPAEPDWLRWMSSLFAATAAALAMFVLPLAIRAERHGRGLETTTPAVRLTCPRCGHGQTLEAGRRRCERCRLIIRFQIEEPRCAGCGFALYKLTGDHCPECGREIPAEERWQEAA
ncbi:MAG: hypothetical protein ACYS0D_02515 [Planctomycetota bacterium]|jgi:hypothetical protein